MNMSCSFYLLYMPKQIILFATLQKKKYCEDNLEMSYRIINFKILTDFPAETFQLF